VSQIVSSSTALLDRFEIVVDPDAEPVDLDQALAEFLLAVVEKRKVCNGS
jgi:hypothetical protein